MRSTRNPSHHPTPYPQPHPHPLTLTIDVTVPIAVTESIHRNRTPYTVSVSVSVNPAPIPSDEMEGIALSSRFAVEARPWVSAVCMGEPLEELIDTAEDTCGESWTRG